MTLFVGAILNAAKANPNAAKKAGKFGLGQAKKNPELAKKVAKKAYKNSSQEQKKEAFSLGLKSSKENPKAAREVADIGYKSCNASERSNGIKLAFKHKKEQLMSNERKRTPQQNHCSTKLSALLPVPANTPPAVPPRKLKPSMNSDLGCSVLSNIVSTKPKTKEKPKRPPRRNSDESIRRQSSSSDIIDFPLPPTGPPPPPSRLLKPKSMPKIIKSLKPDRPLRTLKSSPALIQNGKNCKKSSTPVIPPRRKNSDKCQETVKPLLPPRKSLESSKSLVAAVKNKCRYEKDVPLPSSISSSKNGTKVCTENLSPNTSKEAIERLVEVNDTFRAGILVTAISGSCAGKKGTILKFNSLKNKWVVEFDDNGSKTIRNYKAVNLSTSQKYS